MNDKNIVEMSEAMDSLNLTGMTRVQVEHRAFDFAMRCASEYTGGMWMGSNVGPVAHFVAPESSADDGLYQVDVAGNGFSGRVTPEVMGAAATLIALNHTSWALIDRDEASARIADTSYFALRDALFDNMPEDDVATVMRIID